MLLDEYERWTGDRKLVRDLEYEARAALNWIDEYADLLGNGYIWYQRRNEETGLENQCWKDSWDSISYRDGRLPGFPRATCELQGYAYDAKMRGARLAREIWKDPAFADELEKQAADLKRRFNRDFWVADDEYFALALDPEGNQVDALTSNNGHLLWSGIVDKSKAKAVVRHLMGPRLFSGWGVRTLAEGEGRYNPIGYHVGTIWPFDNSFIAWGLRRYGFKDEAAQIAAGILDAAEFFDGRLPEAFGGLRANADEVPGPVPDRVQPAGLVDRARRCCFLRTMLGLEPLGDHLVVDPALPSGIGRLELLDIPGRWGRIDAFGRGRVTGREERARQGASARAVKTTSDDERRSGLAAAAGRLAFFPARAAARASRDQLGAAADDVLVPEVARLIDGALASSLPEEVTRSVVRHRVLERVIEELAASGALDKAVDDALKSRRTDELVDRVLRSDQMRRAIEEVVAGPEVRAAMARQTTGLAEELVVGVRSRAVLFDDRVERRSRAASPRLPASPRALSRSGSTRV